MGNEFYWRELFAGYLNLDYRTDRGQHMEKEVHKLGIPVTRMPAKLPKDYDSNDPRFQVMLNRTPGALPCHMGQVEIMKEGAAQKKNILVMEDDLVICSDIQERLDYIERFINEQEPEFDIIWLGGTFHVGPPYWHNGLNPLLRESNLGKDAERTNDPRMIRTYGAFSTFAYIVNYRHIDYILGLLEEHLHTSIGIDYLFIKIQPLLRTFCFVPGCVKQLDIRSDIGQGMTIFSGFAKLNGTIENSKYWWADRTDEFNPFSFDWKEAAI